VPPQHLPEKLEYLSPLFWKMNYPVLCPPEDAAFGNQLASLQQRLPQQVLPVLLQHIENVDEQPLSGSHFFLPCLALGAALLLEFVEGERGFSACFHQYDFSVDFEAVEGGALELVEDGLVERAIIGVLGLAVAAEHLQLLTALVADHGAFPVVLDVQQQRALLLEAELVQICLGNQRACQHVPEIVQVVIAFSLLRLSLFEVAVLLNYLRLLTLLCLAYLNL
jgi:hypothetical protein